MLPFRVTDSALDDVQKAYDYLEGQENNLGEKLLKKITEYVELIETNPYLFRPGYRQVRQVRVKPFQFVLRYKIYREYIALIQLFHSKRHPKKKSYK